MTKKQLKEKLKHEVEKESKLYFVKVLKEYCNIGLARAKMELADVVWPLNNFHKDFETLWNLLTKEEKHYLRYKIESYD